MSQSKKQVADSTETTETSVESAVEKYQLPTEARKPIKKTNPNISKPEKSEKMKKYSLAQTQLLVPYTIKLTITLIFQKKLSSKD